MRQARATLRAHGLLPEERIAASARERPGPERRRRQAATPGERSARAALQLRGVWHELRDGPAILRGVALAGRRARAWR